MKNKIIAMLLIVLMIFSLAACKKDKKKDSDSKGLNLDDEMVEYDEKYVAETKEEIKALAYDLAQAYEYTLNEDDLASIADFFEEEFVDILTDIKIYPSELTSLIGYTREFIALSNDSETAGGDGPEAISDMYTKFSSVLDADRLGALVYELQLWAIECMLDDAEKNYEEYKYPYLKEDIEYYEDLLRDAKKLGRKSYADALSVIGFTASAFIGAADFEDGGVDVSRADTLEIIKRQGEKFAALDIDEDEWQTRAEMYEVFMPSTGSDYIVALNNDNFFVESADIMPDVLKFYGKVTSNISEDTLSLIESDTEYCYEQAMCRELMKNESDFRRLLSKLESKIPGKAENSEAAAKLSDREGYESFCNSYNTSAEELISAVRVCAQNPNEYTCEELYDAFAGYLAHLNSAVAYLMISP